MIIGTFTLSLYNSYVLTNSVDMLAHAIDNPAPSTVVLISGDRDFAYALSILRLRCYRVVLITLSNAHQSLRAQASVFFDWVSDVLEPVDPTLSHQPTPPRRGKASLPPAHDTFCSDSMGHNPSNSLLHELYDEKSASIADSMNNFQDEPRYKEIARSPPKHDIKPPYLERQTFASAVTSDALSNGPQAPGRVIHSRVASCDTYINENTQTPLTTTACSSELNSSTTTFTPNTSVASTPKVVTCENIMLPRSPTHSALRESMSESIDSTMQMLRLEMDSLQESPSFHQQGSQPPINATRSPPGSPLAHSGISRPANVTATLTTPIIPLSSFRSSATARIPENSRRATSSVVVPDKFKILIKCLKSHRSRGSLNPLRSKISLEIAQNGTIYRQAGVSATFAEYAAIAEQAGIVELGGSESTAWISLKAPWFNARLS